MEKTKEKEILHKYLIEMTEKANPNKYFSRKRILQYIKKKISSEKNVDILYRKGYVRSGENIGQEIDLNDVLPRQSTLGINLEELAQEGEIQKIVTESEDEMLINFYRA